MERYISFAAQIMRHLFRRQMKPPPLLLTLSFSQRIVISMKTFSLRRCDKCGMYTILIRVRRAIDQNFRCATNE